MTRETKLKVLHIATGDLWAGAEVQLNNLSAALYSIPDISIVVVLLNHGTLEHKLRESGISVLVIDETKLHGTQLLSRLVTTIRKLSPHVIHTHKPKENILGSIAGFACGFIPSVRTVHGAPEHRASSQRLHYRMIRFFDWFSGYFLQKRIIAVSDELACRLQKYYPRSKIRVIENGIDLNLIRTNNVKKEKSPIIRNKGIRIGLVGRLAPVKRVDIFLQTAKFISDHHPELGASFHIFGDGPMLPELKRLSQDLKIDKIVKYEGHCDDISAIFRNLDILLLTSDHEGLPMVLLEAMASNVPIIAHAIGGIPKLLDNGACGVLIKDHTPSEYAREIRRLALSTAICSELSEKARSRVAARYSADKNARLYMLEYREISISKNR